jgi:hypothetical protein
LHRYQSNIAQELFDTLTLIQPKGSSGGSEVTREKMVYNMSKELLDKLPLVFNMFGIKRKKYS